VKGSGFDLKNSCLLLLGPCCLIVPACNVSTFSGLLAWMSVLLTDAGIPLDFERSAAKNGGGASAPGQHAPVVSGAVIVAAKITS